MVLEAAKMTEDPHQIIVDTVIPYLDALSAMTTSSLEGDSSPANVHFKPESSIELGIKSPVLIGKEMKILQVFGLYDKMWDLYRTSPEISLDGYHALLEYYLTLERENPMSSDENQDFTVTYTKTIPESRPVKVTKRKIWQIVTAIKSTGQQPNMQTYTLLLDLFSKFYQDKKACVDIMNKISALGEEYSRETILMGITAMARCDMDPSPRLDKYLYK